MGAKEENYRHLGETMIKKFRKRNIDACYCASKEEAVKKVLEMIPKEESVTLGRFCHPAGNRHPGGPEKQGLPDD